MTIIGVSSQPPTNPPVRIVDFTCAWQRLSLPVETVELTTFDGIADHPVDVRLESVRGRRNWFHVVKTGYPGRRSGQPVLVQAVRVTLRLSRVTVIR